jgi:hypothetical protein
MMVLMMMIFMMMMMLMILMMMFYDINDDDINNDDDDDKKSPHSSVFININSLISITIFHPINSPCFSHFLISSTTSLMIRIHHHLH